RSVVIEGPEGPRTLELRVFDGLSGQPPSATPAAPGSAAPIQPPPATPVPAPGSGPVMSTPSRPAPVSPASAADATPPASSEPVQSPDALTTEQQMEAIRQRIEARRAQLRQQGAAPPPPNKTK
ncbi:MAG: hypothetical protein ABWX88_10025, partial [Pseudoxanthomonas sp.]